MNMYAAESGVETKTSFNDIENFRGRDNNCGNSEMEAVEV